MGAKTLPGSPRGCPHFVSLRRFAAAALAGLLPGMAQAQFFNPSCAAQAGAAVLEAKTQPGFKRVDVTVCVAPPAEQADVGCRPLVAAKSTRGAWYYYQFGRDWAPIAETTTPADMIQGAPRIRSGGVAEFRLPPFPRDPPAWMMGIEVYAAYVCEAEQFNSQARTVFTVGADSDEGPSATPPSGT